MTNQQGAPEALPDPSPDQLRAIARTARNSSGSASDDCGPLAYVLHGWRAAAIAFRAHQAALVEAQQPAKAESLRQILTDPENQPNQYGVQFLMHGPKMAFKIEARQFTLDYEPTEPGEFEFMRDALIDAFSVFTPDVKLAQQPTTHVQNPAEIEHVAGDVSKNGPESNMAQQPAPSAAGVVGEVPLPLLVRDIAADLGTTPIQVCTALAQLGFGGHSVNMAVTPRMAKSLRAYFASTTPQADSAPVAAEADTVVLEAALRAIHQAIDLIGEPDTERLRTVRRVLRGAVVVAEDSQPAPVLDERAAFAEHWQKNDGRPPITWEALFAQQGTETPTHCAGRYFLRETQTAWEAWQARAACAPADSVLEDAERYRWLRRWKGQEHEPPFTVQHEVDGTLWGGDLDAAVDAARKQGGKP